jgi:hypothetical protein
LPRITLASLIPTLFGPAAQKSGKQINVGGIMGYKCYMWGSGKDGRCGTGKDNNEKVPS